MLAASPTAEKRSQIIGHFFPDGVPSLWCPLLTHYDERGGISDARTAAHLKHLSPFIRGFLIPGSTGDGWELTERETRRVIEIALGQAGKLGFSMLIGILKPKAEAVLPAIQSLVKRLVERTGEADPLVALQKTQVCGFAVCPPTGKAVRQEDMLSQLSTVLETGLPIALYQLPQVTKNELSTETVKELADRFPNFLLFKDSSGTDRVALALKNLGGVVKLRGAETDYAKWLSGTRARYEGFLLSTSNCFARELTEMIDHCRAGRTDAAKTISDRLSAIIIEVFQLVSAIESGNAFANANKAMDHLFAHGSKAMQVTPPCLHDRTTIPIEMIRRTAEVLARHDALPLRGYLE